MNEDTEGFYYPVVDEKKCVNCNLCEKVCPIKRKKNEIKSYGLMQHILKKQRLDFKVHPEECSA